MRPSRPTSLSSTSITEVAERKNATVGQVALAWLLAQTALDRADPRDQAAERLDENLGTGDTLPVDGGLLTGDSSRLGIR